MRAHYEYIGEYNFTLDTFVVVNANETTDVLLTLFLPLAEPVGPDAYGYSSYDRYDCDYPATYDWVELDPALGGNGTSFSFAHHDSSVFLPAPFPLTFYGDIYNSLTVNANGWMLPGIHYGSAHLNSRIPFQDNYEPHGLIAPYWDDFRSGADARQWSWYDNAHSRWIIEFKNQQLLHPTEYRFDWQVHYYNPAAYPTLTGDANILFVYKKIPYLLGCTIGIENPQETTGLQINYGVILNEHSFPIDSTSAILFTSGSPHTYGTVTGTLVTNPPTGNITSAVIHFGLRAVSPNASGSFQVDSVPTGLQNATLSLAGYELRHLTQIRVAMTVRPL